MSYPDLDWCPCGGAHARDDHATAMATRGKMLELRPEVAAFAQAMEAHLAEEDNTALRDEFARTAMACGSQSRDVKDIAQRAYAIADAMLEARKT